MQTELFSHQSAQETKIESDTGWKASSRGLTYIKRNRTVVFSANSKAEEIAEFAAKEKNKLYGQEKTVRIQGKTVVITETIDSGD